MKTKESNDHLSCVCVCVWTHRSHLVKFDDFCVHIWLIGRCRPLDLLWFWFWIFCSFVLLASVVQRHLQFRLSLKQRNYGYVSAMIMASLTASLRCCWIINYWLVSFCGWFRASSFNFWFRSNRLTATATATTTTTTTTANSRLRDRIQKEKEAKKNEWIIKKDETKDGNEDKVNHLGTKHGQML